MCTKGYALVGVWSVYEEWWCVYKNVRFDYRARESGEGFVYARHISF